METTTTGGFCVGGVIDFPDFCYGNQPTLVKQEQINTPGGSPSVIKLLGNVSQQLTGVYVDGTNINYPGAL